MDRPILIAELGSGGMADVFLAMRCGIGGFKKLVVIKRLRMEGIEDDLIAMFHDEARISALLNHPNVVQTHEVGFDGEHYCLEMEYLDGQTLHRLVARAAQAGRPLTTQASVAIVRSVLAGLHYAHELSDYAGVALNAVHRDVSPQNIFVTYDGRVKLVDFGIAKAVGRQSATCQGLVKGKLRYMAPEQALGSTIDRRADIFATGVILWQLLVDRKYWSDVNELEIYHRLREGLLPPSPRAVRPDVPEALDRIVARALEFEPDERYATAEAFASALDDAVELSPSVERDLGRLAADLFADSRRKTKAVIEKSAVEKIAAELAERGNDACASINLPRLPSSSSSSSTSNQMLMASSSRALTSPQETPVTSVTSLNEPVTTNLRGRSHRWWAYSIFGAVAFAIAAISFVATRESEAPKTAPAPSAIATQVSTTAAPLPPTPAGVSTLAAAPEASSVAEGVPSSVSSRAARLPPTHATTVTPFPVVGTAVVAPVQPAVSIHFNGGLRVDEEVDPWATTGKRQ